MSLFCFEPSLTVLICRNYSTIPRLFNQIPTIPTSIIRQSSSISLRQANPTPRLYSINSSNPSSSLEPDDIPSTTIFIKGLPQSTSEGTLRSAFSKFGEVSRVKIITYEKSKGNTGFAYVWFVNGDCAENAVVEMNGKGDSFGWKWRRLVPARHGEMEVESHIGSEFSCNGGDLPRKSNGRSYHHKEIES